MAEKATKRTAAVSNHASHCNLIGFPHSLVRLLTGFLLPLILGALLFALCDGWRDGTWFEQWGRCLPLVSVVMALPTLLYTITMEIAATSMQRRGIDNRPVLIALSTFLGLLAGGLLGVMALIGMPVGLVCGFVLMRLR
ncbi:hypothetical protein [Paraburkholderia bryophila]|uniref:Uncharacterized protein n=1 Tax=Paraburkholderia bryophila TaxID=420952 RepID=A0A329BER4_9BURK|nr:hypothetical protein [Paraburkholderia bryophila]RAS20809.1 hypothetical protein BX591_1331 [Paraburkholderia bryophila]